MVTRGRNRVRRPGRKRRQGIPVTARNDQRLLSFDTTVYHGREEINPFPAGNAGFTVSSNVVNMSMTTQLLLFQSLFSEFRFSRLEFIYVPSSATTTLGEMFISYSNDVHAGAPASITAVSSRGLSIQVPGTNAFVTMPSVRRRISELNNVLTIPRSYNNLTWFRCNTAAGVTDFNSVGIVHYGTQSVQNGVIPGTLWFDYTVICRSHV